MDTGMGSTKQRRKVWSLKIIVFFECVLMVRLIEVASKCGAFQLINWGETQVGYARQNSLVCAVKGNPLCGQQLSIPAEHLKRNFL